MLRTIAVITHQGSPYLNLELKLSEFSPKTMFKLKGKSVVSIYPDVFLFIFFSCTKDPSITKSGISKSPTIIWIVFQ